MWSPGFDSQAGGGQAAVDQVGAVLDLLQLALDDADQAVQVGSGEVGHGPLEQRPDALGGHESAPPASRPSSRRLGKPRLHVRMTWLPDGNYNNAGFAGPHLCEELKFMP